MQRNDYLDFSKGVLITLVCVGHIVQFGLYQNSGFWVDPLFKTIYMFHMPLLMAAAGYSSFRGIAAASDRIHLFQYLKKRIISYLLPIVAWAILFRISVYVLLDYRSPDGLLAAITRDAANSYWFLWALLGSMCLTAIAQATGKYRLLMLGAFFIGTLALPEQNQLWLFKYTFPFFVVGFLCAPIRFSEFTPGQLRIMLLVFAVASYFCFMLWNEQTYIYNSKFTLTPENVPNIALRWASGIILSLFALIVFYFTKPFVPKPLMQFFLRAGKDSLYIYILQRYAAMLIARIAHYSFEPLTHPHLWHYVLALTLGFIVSYIGLRIGLLIASNPYASYILFGKKHKLEPVK